MFKTGKWIVVLSVLITAAQGCSDSSDSSQCTFDATNGFDASECVVEGVDNGIVLNEFTADGNDEGMYNTIFAHNINHEHMKYCSDDKPEIDTKRIAALNSISSTLINDNFVNRNSLFGESTVSTSTSFDQMPSVLLRKNKSKHRKKRFSLIEKRFGTTKHIHQPTRTQKQLLHDLTPKWQRPVVKKKKKF